MQINAIYVLHKYIHKYYIYYYANNLSPKQSYDALIAASVYKTILFTNKYTIHQ